MPWRVSRPQAHSKPFVNIRCRFWPAFPQILCIFSSSVLSPSPLTWISVTLEKKEMGSPGITLCLILVRNIARLGVTFSNVDIAHRFKWNPELSLIFFLYHGYLYYSYNHFSFIFIAVDFRILIKLIKK